MENSMKLDSNNVAQTCGSCGSRFLRKIKRLKPINFWQEAKCVSRLAGPVILAQVMVLLINVVSAVFCGHFGKVELNAVNLATMIINVAGIALGVGLATACDTLISQTFGNKNLKRIGVIVQRGILFLMITCFPCWAFLINIEHILLAFKQSPAVAKLTQLYVLIFIPGLPAAFLYDLETRYLQNQGITMPQIVTGLIANILNAVINYLFLYVLALGVEGSAAANVISRYCQAILLFGYIRWKKLHVNTWPGWSTDCLQEWGRFTRLAIPSLLMLCIEWWAYDTGMLYVGLINDVQLGAHGIIFQILIIAYRVPLGYSTAATVHVGNALGASNPEQAVNSAKVALCCMGCISLIITVIIGGTKTVVGYIFTNDREIIHLVSETIPICAVYHFFEAMTCVCGGVLRGAGKQKLGAIGNIVGFYLIGLPIGISLMFAAKLGVFGLWSGILIAGVVQLIFFLNVIYRINWKEAADEALVNAGVMRDVETSTGISAGQTQYLSTGNSATNPIPNGCELEPKINNGRVTDESSILDTGVTTVGEILSTKQLIIRRGLAFLSGPLILAIGLAIHFSLEKDP
ncbi:multidrug and toxin extrusion protein 1-like isoform X1 [Scyliorhinus canicula]|uniref:multidrug and toxin extrusion protein 1-like isoform X1 n=1 Tax=Scyliorhinus canicula TaxID=7830 RepID=UPI0018F304C3|nr:multidrug and toxin extrusion protein 1-like isoform X1 [Scyliorhinus canicula]XP_038670492.1 multidrug and toxin extrusion protein 1-like isoform X1 [Scyliorhinus canicula]